LKLQANFFAIATAFSIPWLFVVLVPNASMMLIGKMVHADLSVMSLSLKWNSFFIGLLGRAV
jgi:hypothetical protein